MYWLSFSAVLKPSNSRYLPAGAMFSAMDRFGRSTPPYFAYRRRAFNCNRSIAQRWRILPAGQSGSVLWKQVWLQGSLAGRLSVLFFQAPAVRRDGAVDLGLFPDDALSP